MKKLKNPLNIYMVNVIIISIIILLPLIYIARYNHPSADDFEYSVTTASVWANTHSFPLLLSTALQKTMHSYMQFQGTYISCFLMSLQPAIFGDSYYSITTLIMLLSIWGGNFIFVYVFFIKLLKVDRLTSTALWALVSSYMTQFAPSPVETFYWYVGATHYTFFYWILMTIISIHSVFIVGDRELSNKKNILLSVVGSVFGFIIAGGNFITSLLNVMINAVVIALLFLLKRKRQAVGSIFIMVFSFTGFLINVLAPGNDVRQSEVVSGGKDPVTTIFSSIIQGILSVDKWIGLKTIIFLVLLSPIIMRIIAKYIPSEFRFNNPFIVTIISCAFVCGMYAPPVYADESIFAGRVSNIIFFIFVVTLVFNEFYYIGYLFRRTFVNGENTFINFIQSLQIRKTTYVLLTVVTFVLASVCLKNSAYYKSFNSILSGEAKAYEAEWNERMKYFSASKGKDATPDPFKNKPEVLFLTDMGNDPDVFPNKFIAEYYGLKSVRLYHEN